MKRDLEWRGGLEEGKVEPGVVEGKEGEGASHVRVGGARLALLQLFRKRWRGAGEG